MSYAHVMAFGQRVKDDAQLRKEVAALEETARDARPARLVQLGHDAAFTFTADELLDIEAVTVFWQKVQGDRGLQARLERVGDFDQASAAAEVVNLAREAGFSFTAEALIAATSAKAEGEPGELTDEQLDAVAGGRAQGRYRPPLIDVF
jgi:predicted ribosomally synthesized peptide with nif11-like leader